MTACCMEAIMQISVLRGSGRELETLLRDAADVTKLPTPFTAAACLQSKALLTLGRLLSDPAAE